MRLAVPKEILATAADPIAWKSIVADLYGTVAPKWWSRSWSRVASSVAYSRPGLRALVGLMVKSAVRAHGAGVKTAIGSKR